MPPGVSVMQPEHEGHLAELPQALGSESLHNRRHIKCLRWCPTDYPSLTQATSRRLVERCRAEWRMMFSGSGSLRASGEFSLKVKSMWEGSARSRRPAGEWSVMPALLDPAYQAVVMDRPQDVVGYARGLTPALSPIETSPYRARDRQRPKW